MKGKPSRPSYEAPAPAPPRNDPRHDQRSDPRSDPKYHHDEDQTPRVQRPASQAVKQSPYFGLQDAPSPSGRLSDRIQRLKQRYDVLTILYLFLILSGHFQSVESNRPTTFKSLLLKTLLDVAFINVDIITIIIQVTSPALHAYLVSC